MSKSEQLFLLADHVKLSLLERQRAKSLGLDSDSQDGHISRSLDQLRHGLSTLKQESLRLGQKSDDRTAGARGDPLEDLQKQLDDLTAQFHGFSNPSANDTLNHANSDELAPDFAHATALPSVAPIGRKPKTVRFSDSPPSPSLSQDLFGQYRDDPNNASDSAGYSDQTTSMTNQQIHEYHSQILEEQDEQLDRLGESIGRQRELSMQIGDELESHVAMLDEVDGIVDRHQNRLDRAKRMLGKVAKSAGENKQLTLIFVLIIVLVLLIAILK